MQLWLSQPLGDPNTASTAIANANGKLAEDAEKKVNQLISELKEKWPLVESDVEIDFKSDNIVAKESVENLFMVILTKRSGLDWIGAIFGTSETKIANEIDCPTINISGRE